MTVERSGAGHVLSGTVQQSRPVYRPRLALEIEAEDGSRTRHLMTTDEELTSFSFQLERPPRAITVDPDYRVFRWYAESRIPIGFADAWKEFRKRPGQLVLGRDLAAADAARIESFLRQRFHDLDTAASADVRHGILVGEPARELRLRRMHSLDAPPPGTVQAFVLRSASDVLVDIEGEWPDAWPEIIPEAPLNFVRYRGGAIVSATAPALPRIVYELGTP